MPQSRGYHHGDLQRTLLSSALVILDRGGVEAVTVREVARSAGVTHSAPANHFEDRSALLTSLAVTIIHDLTAMIDTACLKAGKSRREQLEAFAAAVMQFAFANPHRYRLLWRTDVIDQSHRDIDASAAALYRQLRNIVVASKRKRSNSADTAVIAAWSIIHGYVSLRLDGTLAKGIDELSGLPREQAIIDALIDGIG